MKWLGDRAVAHLRRVAEWPDFGDTRYEPLERLGEGGMAAVFLARDRELDRLVAIKVARASVANRDDAERTLAEARVLARLEHPGIVPVHDAGVLTDGRAYVVMKRVRGERLDQYAGRSPTLPDKLLLFLKICDTVAFAHTHGIIHRDLKPENVMVGEFGEVLVMDWGIARWGDSLAGDAAESNGRPPSERQTAHGAVMGTPGFMAPEQARGEVDRIDQRTDVYALGALLGALLDAPRGGPPGPSSPPVPPALRAICARAMADQPEERYPTVRALAEDVTRHLAGRRVSAFREGVLGALGRWASRYQTALYLVAAYLVMRILLLVWAGV